MEQVAGHVEMGVKELRQAEKTQKQNKGLLCIIVLAVLICVMIVFLMFK